MHTLFEPVWLVCLSCCVYVFTVQQGRVSRVQLTVIVKASLSLCSAALQSSTVATLFQRKGRKWVYVSVCVSVSVSVCVCGGGRRKVRVLVS